MTKTPISQAVEPQRAEAVAKAATFASDYAEKVIAAIEAAGWDLNAYAPYPDSRMNRPQYMAAKLKREIAETLTTRLPNQRYSMRVEPLLVERNDAGIARFVQDSRDAADAQYSLFVSKLELKVGKHSAAAIAGWHVWGRSLLTVETPTGTQRWKTQQIVNVSVLGKVFNQWPSRIVR